MNETQLERTNRILETKLQQVSREVAAQKGINDEIRQRFQLLVDQINNIKDILNIN